jgi:septal ring factor EnvC (AmiA/AmiB activator)
MHPPKPKTSAELHLIKENDGLRTDIVGLRRELANKQDYASRLEVLLRERMERIDQLIAQVDQLREQIKRLDQENEHLAAIIAASKVEAA